MTAKDTGTSNSIRPRRRRDVTLDDTGGSIYALAAGHEFMTGEVIVIDGGFTATT